MRRIIACILLLLSMLLSGCGSIITIIASASGGDIPAVSGLNFSDEVLAYYDLVIQYAEIEGVRDYVAYLLAIMQVESGGRGSDVMQSSESLGLPPDSLEPEASIAQGVHYFAYCLNYAESAECDLNVAIQAYNYGSGFIGYVVNNSIDRKYTLELAVDFARIKSNEAMVPYNDPIAISYNGGFKYQYGSMFYIPHVLQYITVARFDDDTVQMVMDEALKYQGWGYVWGGSNPDSGFDCSGLTQWCYRAAGIKLPRTAQAQYDFTQHIDISEAQPGDLVFFTGTYETDVYITHVGIYIGNSQMYDSGGIIGYTNLTEHYWSEHLVCFGRIKRQEG